MKGQDMRLRRDASMMSLTFAPSTSTFSWIAGPLQKSLCSLIEGEIELQDIDARLAKQPEGSCLGMLADQLAELLVRHSASFCDAPGLKKSVVRSDVRIEP